MHIPLMECGKTHKSRIDNDSSKKHHIYIQKEKNRCQSKTKQVQDDNKESDDIRYGLATPNRIVHGHGTLARKMKNALGKGD